MPTFLEILLSAAAEALPDAQVVPTGEASLTVTLPDGTIHHVHADLVEYETRDADLEQRRAACVRLIQVVVVQADQRPDSGAGVPWDRLFTIVRPASMMGEHYDKFVWRPVVGGLVENLCVDTPESVVTISKGQLEQWGVTGDVAPLFERGRANLRATRDAQTFVMTDIGGQQLLVSNGPQGYETSWAVLSDVLSPFTAPDQAVVFLPTRFALIVVPQSRPDLCQAALHWSRSMYAEHPRAMAQCGFVLTSHGLDVWDPPVDHPCAAAQADAAAQQVIDDYRALADTLPAGSGYVPQLVAVMLNTPAAGSTLVPRPAVVASFDLSEVPPGEAYLLPAQASYVAVADGSELTLVPTKAVLKAYGSSAVVDGVWPPCYRIADFTERDLLEFTKSHGQARVIG